MENFVYCNNCFRSKHSSTVLFHVTSCRHVYCDACKDECTQDTCKMCGAPCSTVALSHDMAPAFHELFQDPENIRRRAYMACEFQNSQLVRLCKQQELKLAKLQNKYFKAVGCWIKRCRRYNAVAEEAADLRAKLRDERAKRQPSSGPSTSRVSVKMDSRAMCHQRLEIAEEWCPHGVSQARVVNHRVPLGISQVRVINHRVPHGISLVRVVYQHSIPPSNLDHRPPAVLHVHHLSNIAECH